MSGSDFEELLRSPLDDSRPPDRMAWRQVAAGVVAGVLVAVAATALVDRAGGDTSTTVSVSSTTASADAGAASDYPRGYVELAPGLGARPTELIRGDGVVTLGFTSAVKRGADQLAEMWPLGGIWWLESTIGIGAESERMVLGRFNPGAFAVEFPADPFVAASGFSHATLIERWDHPKTSGSANIAFSGEPFVAPDPITIPITQETTLVISELELGRFLGRVTWQLQGASRHGGRVVIGATLLDDVGNVVGSYSAFPEVLEPSDRGTTEVFWQEPFPTDQSGATTVMLEYTVGVVEVVPTEIEFDLQEIPVG